MASAEVGDDVFDDDPTVHALQDRAAELLGKEAGLFVASGAMGNIVAQLAHLSAGPGDDRRRREPPRPGRGRRPRRHRRARASGRSRNGRTGRSTRRLIREAFRDPTDVHEPITGLIAIENTHAHSMGQPLEPGLHPRGGRDRPRARRPLHVDGARFWNAVVAQGVRPTDLSGPADSVSFCLSKGLACPVGSVVVGSRDFIWRARRGRKLVGGGMRQVGILAAAGLVALRDGPAGMIERLAEDHANARRLAEALAGMDGVVSPGANAQPDAGPARSRIACARTSCCSRSNATGRRSSPRSAPGAS